MRPCIIWSEKSQPQSLQTVSLYFHNVLEMTNYRNGKQMSGCLLSRKKESHMITAMNRNVKHTCGDANALSLVCIQVNPSL